MKEEKKSKGVSKAVFLFVILALIFVLIVFILNGGLDTTQGIYVSLGVVALIIVGFIRQVKVKPKNSTNFSNDSVNSLNGNTTQNDQHVEMNKELNADIQSSSKLTTTPFQEKFTKMMASIPKNKQPLVIGVGIVSIIIVIVLFFSLISGALFAASPVGTWNQEGYEERVTYYIYEDGTFIYMDYDEQSGTGYWVQTGKHIDFHWLTYYDRIYEDNYETSYYVIHGDYMTSGGVVLNKISE